MHHLLQYEPAFGECTASHDMTNACLGAATAPDSQAQGIVQARRGFQSQLSQLLSVPAAAHDASAVATFKAAALFERVVPRVVPQQQQSQQQPQHQIQQQTTSSPIGVAAAAAVLCNVLAAIPTEVSNNLRRP